MNLTTCTNCGVVLNKDYLPFPDDIFQEDGSIDHTKACWTRSKYVALCKCPICKSEIPQEEF